MLVIKSTTIPYVFLHASSCAGSKGLEEGTANPARTFNCVLVTMTKASVKLLLRTYPSIEIGFIDDRQYLALVVLILLESHIKQIADRC